MTPCLICGYLVRLPDPKYHPGIEFCSYTCFEMYQNDLALEELEQKENPCVIS